MTILAELKRRNVIRAAVLYVLVSWVILQVADVLFGALGIPEWGVRLVLGLLVLGLPLVLIFSWVYELTPEGLKRESEVERGASITHRTGRKIDLVIAVLLAVVVAIVLYDRLNPTVEQATQVRAVYDREPAEQAPAPTDVSRTLGPPNSIAVLPFVNMSADADNEYFSDGLSEELLNLLAGIPELRVAARTSSFSFKGKDVDIPTVGSALGVAHVLEGSVRKAGNRVRITAQLIKTDDGYHVWSETYDRDLVDIFAIQDEIAEAVVAGLRVTLLGAPVASAREHATDPEAYEAYLLGLHHDGRNTREDFKRAVQEYDRALAIDPNYAPAWAGKALALSGMAGYGFLPFDEGFAAARQAANQAISLDPELAMARRALGEAMLGQFDFGGAMEQFELAVTLAPGDASSLLAWAKVLAQTNRHAEAAQVMRRVIERNPLDLQVLAVQLFAQVYSMKLDQADDTLARMRALHPGAARLALYGSLIAMRRGDYRAMLELTDAIPDDFSFMRRLNHAVAYYLAGDHVRAQESLDRLIDEHGHNAAMQIAVAYAVRGEEDKMFEWLDRAYETRDPGLSEIYTTWVFEPDPSDPRWDALFEKMGLKDVIQR